MTPGRMVACRQHRGRGSAIHCYTPRSHSSDRLGGVHVCLCGLGDGAVDLLRGRRRWSTRRSTAPHPPARRPRRFASRGCTHPSQAILDCLFVLDQLLLCSSHQEKATSKARATPDAPVSSDIDALAVGAGAVAGVHLVADGDGVRTG